MLDDWAATATAYGVRPGVFASLYVASFIPFYVGIWDAAQGWRYKRSSRVRRGLLLNRCAWATPYVYVMVAGYGLPGWIQASVLAGLGVSLAAFTRQARRQVVQQRWTRTAKRLERRLPTRTEQGLR